MVIDISSLVGCGRLAAAVVGISVDHFGRRRKKVSGADLIHDGVAVPVAGGVQGAGLALQRDAAHN
jgi:hypothetical protein